MTDVSDADKQFIKKRRTRILVSTRNMLLQDYHNSVVVKACGPESLAPVDGPATAETPSTKELRYHLPDKHSHTTKYKTEKKRAFFVIHIRISCCLSSV